MAHGGGGGAPSGHGGGGHGGWGHGGRNWWRWGSGGGWWGYPYYVAYQPIQSCSPVYSNQAAITVPSQQLSACYNNNNCSPATLSTLHQQLSTALAQATVVGTSCTNNSNILT